MQDEVPMGVLDGRTDGLEKPETGGNRQTAIGAVCRDGLAGHQFHNKVALAIGDTAIDHVDDVGLIQQRQDAPFGNEAPLGFGGKESSANQLDGHFALELAVIATGAVDDTHSPFAYLLDQPVWPEALTGP